jgi:hypothetical protein
MNFFNKHPEKDNFRIVAHCFGDPRRMIDFIKMNNAINEIDALSFWFNCDLDAASILVDENKIHFYLQGVKSSSLILRGDKLESIALDYQSTSQMAINIALYLGFKKIYLIGFDHDWLATRGQSPHFYNESEQSQSFDLSVYSYTQMIEISRVLFAIYHKLKKNADLDGAQIINLSVPSLLDVFPRALEA